MISDKFKKELPTTIKLLENEGTRDNVLVESRGDLLNLICAIGYDDSNRPIHGCLQISLENGFLLSVRDSSKNLGFNFSLQGVIDAVNENKKLKKYLDQDHADLFISLVFLCRYSFVNDTDRKRASYNGTKMSVLKTVVGDTTLGQLVNQNKLDEKTLLSLGNSVIEALADISDIPNEVKQLLWETDCSITQRNIISNCEANSRFVNMAIDSQEEVLLVALNERDDFSNSQILKVNSFSSLS